MNGRRPEEMNADVPKPGQSHKGNCRCSGRRLPTNSVPAGQPRFSCEALGLSRGVQCVCQPWTKSDREVRDQLITSVVQDMLLLDKVLTPRELRIDYRWQANRHRVASAWFGLPRRRYARRTRHSSGWQQPPALNVRREHPS
jgi:hypothetical protein